MKYSEDTLAQRTTADDLEQELGWESVYAYMNEDLGPGKVWHWHERWYDMARKHCLYSEGKDS
jgi:hypothetical protein